MTEDDLIVAEILKLGRENPLPREEAKSLLTKIVDRMRVSIPNPDEFVERLLVLREKVIAQRNK